MKVSGEPRTASCANDNKRRRLQAICDRAARKRARQLAQADVREARDEPQEDAWAS